IGWLSLQRARRDGALLGDPIRIPPFNPWEHGEVEDGRRRGRRPLERTPVPGIAGCVAQLIATTEAHDELRDLTPDSNPHEDDPCFREKHPRMPGGDIVMLHASRRAHEP